MSQHIVSEAHSQTSLCQSNVSFVLEDLRDSYERITMLSHLLDVALEEITKPNPKLERVKAICLTFRAEFDFASETVNQHLYSLHDELLHPILPFPPCDHS